MANIRARKGKTGTTYQVRYTDAEGVLRYKNFAQKGAARQFAGTYKTLAREPQEKPKLLNDALDTWLHVCEHVGRKGREPVEIHTLRHYRSEANHLRRLPIKEATPNAAYGVYGKLPLNKLDGPEFIRLRDALLAHHSRHMANRCLKSLKSAVAEAAERGDPAKSLGKGVTIIMGARHKERIVVPSHAEIQLLMDAAEQLALANDQRTAIAWRRYRPMVELQIFSGMRPSEMRGMPLDAFGAKHNAVRIYQRADEKNNIGPPKTPAGFRTIHIPKRVAAMLDAFVKTLPEDAAFIFQTGNAQPETLANIFNRCWIPLLERAGLDKGSRDTPLKFYHLRHFRASTEIAMGANAKDIQLLMGHESVKTTLDIYGHLFEEAATQRVERAEQLDSMFNRAAAAQ
jgi:integrase